jgi:hypothetical protein
MCAGGRDLAGILGPVLLKVHASRRCLIAAGRFYRGAARVHAHFRKFGSGGVIRSDATTIVSVCLRRILW